jgi:beta-galactosidase
MTKRSSDFTPLKTSALLHGADYNPDQWLDRPEVLEEDIRLMKEARCNVMSVGIFSWAGLEPREGEFEFGWLDSVMDRLVENGIRVILATPSGAKPAWMSRRYPEIRRMNLQGLRDPHRDRHNHCRTSPVYREKCQRINTELARRYGEHPALLLWHVSNEYNGDPCHCPLCYDAFREWLKVRYNHDLQALNRAWWAPFWSHTYGDWEEIEPVDGSVHGLILDWKRFTNAQMRDFFQAECEPLRRLTPKVPITTNFIGFLDTLDCWKMGREVDVVSWDCYPNYHDRAEDVDMAVRTSLMHDFHRSIKQQPYLMMESSPGVANWHDVSKLKRPEIHRLEALQAIAHGSDSVQYFQWRKGRGGFEKFHGAVVDHHASNRCRTFRDVAAVGETLVGLKSLVGTHSSSEVAILVDWENRWAIDESAGPRVKGKNYLETCLEHYRPFWGQGVDCDVVDEDSDFTGYKVLVAPMLYMLRPGVAERIEAFVRAGGVFVTTYFSGVVNESDLCFQEGFPGPLRKLMGVWAEELDVLYDDETVKIVAEPGVNAGLRGEYAARVFCDVLHAEGAEVLARYGSEFYSGHPAVTVNRVGKGLAYYIGSRNDRAFHRDFYGQLIRDLELPRAFPHDLPEGVTAKIRGNGEERRCFLLNFSRELVEIDLGNATYRDAETGECYAGTLRLSGYFSKVLQSDS